MRVAMLYDFLFALFASELECLEDTELNTEPNAIKCQYSTNITDLVDPQPKDTHFNPCLRNTLPTTFTTSPLNVEHCYT